MRGVVKFCEAAASYAGLKFANAAIEARYIVWQTADYKQKQTAV